MSTPRARLRPPCPARLQGPPVGPLANNFHASRKDGSRRLVARLGSLGPAGVGGNVTGGGALDQWQNLILDRFDPAGRLGPFGPVPFDKVDAVVTIVIGAAQVNRCGKTGEPQLRPAR